jgi:CBS domain-containing protein
MPHRKEPPILSTGLGAEKVFGIQDIQHEEVAMQVREVMTHNVECVSPTDTVQAAARKMKELDVGSLPVCDNDRLAGMITDRDIAVRVVAEGNNPSQYQVREAMTQEVIFCMEEEDVAKAARLMRDKQVRRLIVLNQDKRLVGIVSLGDLAVETRDAELSGNALEGISEPGK